MGKKKRNPKFIKPSKLTKDDGQLVKLGESKVSPQNIHAPLFGKDVNDPSERGYD